MSRIIEEILSKLLSQTRPDPWSKNNSSMPRVYYILQKENLTVFELEHTNKGIIDREWKLQITTLGNTCGDPYFYSCTNTCFLSSIQNPCPSTYSPPCYDLDRVTMVLSLTSSKYSKQLGNAISPSFNIIATIQILIEYLKEDKKIIHTKEKLYTCNHKIKNTDISVYTCGICEFNVTKQSILENHIKAKHTNKTSVLCEKNFETTFVENYHLCIRKTKLTCPLCEFLTNDERKLKLHMETNHIKP